MRHAKANHFRENNGYPEIYLGYDKMKSNQWYPIPHQIYTKIMAHIRVQGLGDNDPVFEITKKRQGAYQNHRGIITHEWIRLLWLDACKELGLYTETIMEVKQCRRCKYALGEDNEGKCKVMFPKIKRCQTVNIKYCILKGVTKLNRDIHPRLHETLRGGGAQNKVEYYMNQGHEYETALLKVFHMSNWKSYKVFKRYMDMAFEKEIGDHTFVHDFCGKTLIEI